MLRTLSCFWEYFTYW